MVCCCAEIFLVSKVGAVVFVGVGAGIAFDAKAEAMPVKAVKNFFI
jgi:hypothetical protein